MIPEFQIEELYERCLELEMIRYSLQDKIEEILDYLVKTHITIEEMDQVQKIAIKK